MSVHSCMNGSLRLADGFDNSSGRVEFCIKEHGELYAMMNGMKKMLKLSAGNLVFLAEVICRIMYYRSRARLYKHIRDIHKVPNV